MTDGAHTVKAVARDAAGNTTTSTVNVTVDNTKPTVSLAAPAGGAPVSGTVTLSATASDNVGVTQVQFFVDNDTTALGTDTTSPYSASWNTSTVTNGAHTVKAVASDAAGNITTSTVNVTVDNKAPIPVGVTPIAVGPNPIDMTVAGDHLFVLNSGDGSVSVIDTRTNQVVNTIQGVGYASPMVASSDGRYLYMSQYDSYYVTSSVKVIDVSTGTVVATVTMPKCESEGCDLPGGGWANSAGITDIAISPDNSRVYVSELWVGDSFYGATVTMIDTATNTVVGSTSPSQWGDFYSNIEVSPDGSRIYAGSGYPYFPTMDVLDARTLADIDSVPLDGNPGWPTLSIGSLTFSPDGKRAYARTTEIWPTYTSQTFAVIDTDPVSATYNTQIATITVPTGAQYMKVSADGTRGYVVHDGGKTVTVVDLTTNTVIDTIASSEIGGDYAALAISSDGTLYFSNYPNNAVYAVAAGSVNV